MTNTTRMPWMKEDYTETKRAFKKRLGLFDKDEAIEELAAEQTEEDWLELEAEQILMERDEQHQIKLGFRKKRWEDFSIAEIEKEYKQKNKGNKL
jgi:hypothetical protein